jgi:TPR repeat protein
MMKGILVSAFLGCALLCGCYQAHNSNPQPVSKPWPTMSDSPKRDPNRPLSWQLSATQLNQLRRQAWGGDPQSALLLMQYFEDASSSSGHEVEVWRQTAAENGSGVAAAMLASSLMGLGGEQNCLRAKFWFERAAQLDAHNPAAVTTTKANLEVLGEGWEGCLERGKQRAP